MGDKIELCGWPNYKAGLDVGETRASGKYSVYTTFLDHRIMFHVSTLLPQDLKNEQQVTKKRFIGNDIVVIIFKEEGAPIITKTRSQFNHIFIVVQEDPNNENHYLVEVSRKTSVDIFTPLLPYPNSIHANMLHDFICCKALNGEWACYRSKQFKRRLTRARLSQFEEYITDHSN